MELNQDKAVAVTVQYFLRTLMKLERTKYGWSAKKAAQKAKWNTEIWNELESRRIPIETHHWINICAVLDLSDERLARRLDGFVTKNPAILISMAENAELNIFEKAITSPRLIQNQHLYTIPLPPVKTKLYDALSRYSPDGDQLIEEAKKKGFYKNDNEILLKRSFKREDTSEKRLKRRQRLAKYMMEKISDEKLDNLEIALQLIEHNKNEDLDHAIKIFSLVLK